MKKPSTLIRYALATLALCCMQNNTVYSSEQSAYAQLSALMQDRRAWAATAALLFFGSAAWYLWSQYKKPSNISSRSSSTIRPQSAIDLQDLPQLLQATNPTVQFINTQLHQSSQLPLDTNEIYTIILNYSNEKTYENLLHQLKKFQSLVPKNDLNLQIAFGGLINSIELVRLLNRPLTFPTIPKNRTHNRGITLQQVQEILTKHSAIVQSINDVLTENTLSNRINNIHIILNEGDDLLRGKFIAWLNQFGTIFENREAIISLIFDLQSLQGTLPSTSQSIAITPTMPHAPEAASQLLPHSSTQTAPTKIPTELTIFPAVPQALTELAPIPTELIAFPAVPQPSPAAPGESPRYLTTRGFSEDNVQKILNTSNIAVDLIDEILSNRGLTTLSARVEDVYRIVNYGDGAQIQALENWLNQFKAFFKEQKKKEAIKHLIEDLKDIEKISKST